MPKFRNDRHVEEHEPTHLLNEFILGELGLELLTGIDGKREVVLNLLKVGRYYLETFLECCRHRVRYVYRAFRPRQSSVKFAALATLPNQAVEQTQASSSAAGGPGRPGISVRSAI